MLFVIMMISKWEYRGDIMQQYLDIYVFNRDFGLLGKIESYTSLRWLTLYNGIGEFELNCALTKVNYDVLKLGNVVWISDGTGTRTDFAFINFVEAGRDEMLVRGMSGEFLLTTRIAPGKVTITNIENDLLSVIRKYTVENNPIPHFEVEGSKGFQGTTDVVRYFFQLDELLSEFPDWGWKVMFDLKKKRYLFYIHKGYDKSKDVFFSDKLDNFIDYSITHEDVHYKNYAIAAWGKESQKNTIVVEEDRTNGGERFEMFVDCDDMSVKDPDTTPLEEIKKELIPKMRTKIQKAFEKNERIKTIQGTTLNNIFVYGQDYRIGDLVTCTIKQYNIKLIMRVEEVTETWDSNGYNVELTLIRKENI